MKFIIIIVMVFVLLIPLSVNAQESTENIDTELVDVPQSNKTTISFIEYVTLGSLAVNAVLVYFIFRTLQQNKNQYHSLHRPWINIQRGGIDPTDGNCEIIIKNHGNLPAEKMNITYKDLSKKEPKDEDLYSPIHSLMPSQEQSAWVCIVNGGGSTNEKTNEMKIWYNYNIEIKITFSYGKQNKKIIFEMSEDTTYDETGPFIKTTYMD